MSREYPLEIVTPDGKVFDDNVIALSAPGKLGSFGVLAGHAPFLSLLDNGPVKLTHAGGESYFAVSSGVLEVNPDNHVLILADKAIPCASAEDVKSKLNGAR